MGFRPQKRKEVEFSGLQTIETKKLNFDGLQMGFRTQKLKKVELYGPQTIETQRIFWALDHRNSKKLNFNRRYTIETLDHRNSKKLNFVGFRPQKLKEVEFGFRSYKLMGFRPQKLKEVEFYGGLQSIETKRP